METTAWINSEKTKVFIMNDYFMYCGKITKKQFDKLKGITDDIIYHVGDNYFSWYKTFIGKTKKWTKNINDLLK